MRGKDAAVGEWTVEGDTLYLLQATTNTRLAHLLVWLCHTLVQQMVETDPVLYVTSTFFLWDYILKPLGSVAPIWYSYKNNVRGRGKKVKK